MFMNKKSNIVKMSIFSNFDKINIIPIKIPSNCFVTINELILKRTDTT